jgi:DNA-binding NtrC family response regulator
MPLNVKPGAVTILAVDDEPANNELVQRVFRSRPGYNVVTCLSATEGLEVLKQRHVDVLLVDYTMPDMNGVQLAELAAVMAPGTIVVAVTAYPDVKAVFEAHKSGLISYIVAKPWTPDDLTGAIDRALSVRAMRRAVNELHDLKK